MGGYAYPGYGRRYGHILDMGDPYPGYGEDMGEDMGGDMAISWIWRGYGRGYGKDMAAMRQPYGRLVSAI